MHRRGRRRSGGRLTRLISLLAKGAHVGRYAVDPAQLHDVDHEIESIVTHAHIALETLRAEMRSLLDAGWRSPAATTFATCWHEWHASATDLLTALEEMGQAIGMSAHGYATTEQSVRSSVASS